MLKGSYIEKGSIDLKGSWVIGIHGPYRPGGPKLVTLKLREPVLVGGTIVKYYTLPLDIWKERKRAA